MRRRRRIPAGLSPAGIPGGEQTPSSGAVLGPPDFATGTRRAARAPPADHSRSVVRLGGTPRPTCQTVAGSPALRCGRRTRREQHRDRRAHRSPPGPQADTSLARVRRRRRAASRRTPFGLRGSSLPSEFCAPRPLPSGFPEGGARGSARRLFRGCGHAVRRHGRRPAARLRHAPVHPPERPSGLRRPPHPSPERPPQSPLPLPSGTSRSASQRLEPPKSLFVIFRLHNL